MITFTCPECDEEMEITDRMAGKQIKCIGCGERVTVPKKSQRSRRREEDDEEEDDEKVTRKRPLKRKELRSIALFQKAILICILFSFASGASVFLISAPEVRLVVGLFQLAIGVVSAVFVFQLAIKLYGIALGIVLGIVTLIPCLGLIALLIVNARATSTLQLHGHKVGLMGASLSDFD